MSPNELSDLAAKCRGGEGTPEERAIVRQGIDDLKTRAAGAQGEADSMDAEIDASKSVAESARIVSQALSVLEASKEQFNGLVKDFQKMQRDYIESLRLMRMSSVKELSEMRRELGDVRRFFLDAEHAKEVASLKEFVEVCERMKALKDSGFLDTIADTILKLS